MCAHPQFPMKSSVDKNYLDDFFYTRKKCPRWKCFWLPIKWPKVLIGMPLTMGNWLWGKGDQGNMISTSIPTNDKKQIKSGWIWIK